MNSIDIMKKRYSDLEFQKKSLENDIIKLQGDIILSQDDRDKASLVHRMKTKERSLQDVINCHKINKALLFA
jgi:uncharacterized secreted protein with C-terminal beta-propeller domain